MDGKYIYIGSTVDNKGFGNRFNTHQWSLKANKARNQRMQNLYNKYGDKYFAFNIFEYMDNKSEYSIRKREEVLIQEHRNNTNKELLNLSDAACGGGYWRRFKTAQEMVVINSKKRLSPIMQFQRNQKHKKTLSVIPTEIKEDRIANQCKTYLKNRKTHSNYKPIQVIFDIPGEYGEYIETYRSELEFFKKTKFEDSILRKLKREKKHTVARILKNTKHSYPLGTVLTLQ